ncbi:MAG: hypothetical protein K6U03_11560, partial [Firmicutes bacterium]|nr:hypothetical protein [Bacillota bacterium]
MSWGTIPKNTAGGTVTLVEGSTFCLSNSSGDIQPSASHGLFFRDARLLSRWELRLDGQQPHALSVITPEAFAADFLLVWRFYEVTEGAIGLEPMQAQLGERELALDGLAHHRCRGRAGETSG